MPYVGKSMDRRRNARRRQLSGAHTAESWNASHPVGTRAPLPAHPLAAPARPASKRGAPWLISARWLRRSLTPCR